MCFPSLLLVRLPLYSVHSRPIPRDVYSQQKKIPFFFSSSIRCSVKSSTTLCARATPFTTFTTSSVLGTPDESRTDFRTSQWEVSGFRRGTGTNGILAVGPNIEEVLRFNLGSIKRFEEKWFGPYATPPKRLRILRLLVRDQEAGGSNPLAPTILFNYLSRTAFLWNWVHLGPTSA